MLNLDGVAEAVLYQNVTDITDADGIPPHCMWLVVSGGANTDIANAIYTKISYGANMKGDVVVTITTASGIPTPIKFDRPTPANLYISFDAQAVVAIPTYDLDAIKAYIVDNLTYGIGAYAETSLITEIAREAFIATGGDGVPVNVEISSDNFAYITEQYLAAPSLDSQWVLDVSHINITVLM